MENQEQIDYEFDAHRLFMKPYTETTSDKILRDNILLKFRFDVEKEIVRLRAKAEEELNATHLI